MKDSLSLFDTHTHFCIGALKSHFDDIYTESVENGVKYFINIGTDYESGLLALCQSQKYHNIFAAVGWHPCDAKTYNRLQLLEMLGNKKVAALGEIGLDYYHDISFKEIQKTVFEEQINIAIEHDLPVIIHTRESQMDVKEILSKYAGSITGIIHCFPGDEEYAKWAFEEMGFYIAFCGNLTYKKSQLEKSVEVIPEKFLLAESDSPYLSPVPFRGKLNKPWHIKYIVEAIAGIKNRKYSEMEQIIFNNACAIFDKAIKENNL